MEMRMVLVLMRMGMEVDYGLLDHGVCFGTLPHDFRARSQRCSIHLTSRLEEGLEGFRSAISVY